ncbi:MAG TPA: hypothetical protein VIA18_16115 [Polyangia bacterium]|jgi:hypothetical protein|nr:hypothetical protein [Polyangia bacterium]
MKRTAIAMAICLTAAAGYAAPKKKHPVKHPSTAPVVPPPAPSTTSEAPTADVPPPAAADNAAAVENATPATPPPAPPPPPEASGKSSPVDLEALASEYNQLRDELFRSRAKAHLIGDALFKTKITSSFVYKAQRAWPIKKVTLKIDDQPVFTADSPATGDPLKLYDGFAAPGRHTLSLKVECGATGEDRVGYGAEGSFVIDATEKKETRVSFTVDESGDGPTKIAKHKEGIFDVRVKADVETVEIVK